MNESDIHIDFMIGSPELTVTGITRDGERAPVLVGGSWQI
jgi:aminopeptidase